MAILKILPASALAKPHFAIIPLQDGQLTLQTLQDRISGELHIPNTAWARLSLKVSLNLRSLASSTAVHAFNSAMEEGMQFVAGPDALTIEFDPDRLPKDWNQTCDAIIRFTETAAPEATARQKAQMGLLLPDCIDPRKPLVILIHGLDGDAGCCIALRDLMAADGREVAIFAYPAERPLSESSDFLVSELTRLHHTFPKMKIEFVTQSMGGLLAREYVEGPAYGGDVERLILIAPPNEGSSWAKYSILSKLTVNTFQYFHDRQWSPAWMITEGICQAGSDLEPNSEFLTELNSHGRRAGVKYTIVAGDRPVAHRIEAEALSTLADALPRDVWGWSAAQDLVECEADHLLNLSGHSDGPVTLSSAALPGVGDFVVLHADHNSLYESVNGQVPAAWSVIRERLAE